MVCARPSPKTCAQPPSPCQPVHFASLSSQASSSSSPTASPSFDPARHSDDTCHSPVCTSDSEDEKVFFGPRQSLESDIITKLSSTVFSPLKPDSSPIMRPPVRKRDSREFIRRKTILLSVQRNDESELKTASPPKKTWEGGFFEKTLRGLEDDQQSEDSTPSCSPNLRLHGLNTTPSRSGDISSSDLTLDFSVFRISEPSPSTKMKVIDNPPPVIILNSDTEDSVSESASEEDDSDKENREVSNTQLQDFSGWEGDGILREPAVVLGLVNMDGAARNEEDGETTDEDISAELDLGGLRLSDFSDPETGHEPVSENFEHNQCTPHASAPTTDDEADIIEEEVHISSDVAAVIDTSEQEISELFSTPVAGHQAANTSASSPSTDLDSPLPLARAGPVVIPILASHHLSIRAETGSPYRALPLVESPRRQDLIADPALLLADEDDDATLRFPALGSPRRTPHSGILHTPVTKTPFQLPPAPASVTNATPSTQKPFAPIGQGLANKGDKVLKSALATSHMPGSLDRSAMTSKPRQLNPAKTAARAQMIHEQLSAAVSGRFRMGPPQRSISASSASSTSSSSSAAQRPPSRVGGTTQGLPTKVAKAAVNVSSTTLALGSSSSATQAVSRTANMGPPNRPQHIVTGSSKPMTQKLFGNARPGFKRPENPSSAANIKAVTKPPVPSAPRPVLAPRTFPSLPPAARNGGAFPHSNKAARPVVPLKTLAVQPVYQTVPLQAMCSVPAAPNPLKRSLAHAFAPTNGASLLTESASLPGRSALGMPSRLVRDATNPYAAPVFSIGVGGEGGYSNATMAVARSGFKSPFKSTAIKRGMPGTPLGSRSSKLGTPSRLFGTPSRNKPLPPVGFMTYSVASFADQGDTVPLYSSVEAPPSASTRAASDVTKVENSVLPAIDSTPRGSSEDHEDVSFQIPHGAVSSSEVGSSPITRAKAKEGDTSIELGSPDSSSSSHQAELEVKPTPAPSRSESADRGRIKRALRSPPTAPMPRPRAKSQPAATALSIVPNMSEKELRATTALNTSKNQVYLCAIERQIIRKDIPRPPSPTSKIPTIQDKEETTKKAGRGARAKRRAGEEQTEEEVEVAIVERIELRRGKGDDEDWVTPARPVKKVKKENKSVMWDKGLEIIRDDGILRSKSRAGSVTADPASMKSAMRSAQVQLDQHGNMKTDNRPEEKLKRAKVTVTAVFYEGEEPVPGQPEYLTVGQGKGIEKGKKK